MVFYLLDKNFNRVSIIDNYESAIWTDRYLEPGDFELYIPIGNTIPSSISIGKYLMFTDSEHLMIIESLKIETDIEDGNKLIVTGRSAESILDRRIVYNRQAFEDVQVFNVVYNLIAYNALYSRLAFEYEMVIPKGTENPKNEGWYEFDHHTDEYVRTQDTSVTPGKTYYKISERGKRRCFFHEPVNEYDEEYEIFQVDLDASTEVSNLTNLKHSGEYFGDTLLDVITDICKDKKVGFKVILREDKRDGHKKFFFSMYKGKDRTDRTKTSYVEFSSNIENLLNSDYLRNEKPHKNCALCVGPEEDAYDKVDPSDGDNPQEEGWYVFITDDNYNEYVPTEDTHVVSGKPYYYKDTREKRRYKVVVGDNKKGLNRKELYVDCSSTSRQEDVTYDKITNPPSGANPKEEGWYGFKHYDDPDRKDEYIKTTDEEVDHNYTYYIKNTHTKNDPDFEKLLKQRGQEKLDECKREIKFEGEVDYTGTFKYGKHYKIGDIVQLTDEYGFSGKARVTEYIYSEDLNGLKCYPKFEMIDDEEG